jgi:signal transduction histidine kinase
MTATDARSHAVQAIEHALAHLDEALFQLDRIPAFDQSAIGIVARATNSYLAVNEATLNLLSEALGSHPNGEVQKWLDGLRHLGTLVHHTVGRLVRVTAPSEFPLKPEAVDLPLLMQRACDYYQSSAEQKQAKIILRSVGNVPPVWADRVGVAVVADNLLSSALNLADRGGAVVVQITSGPGGVVCSMCDHEPTARGSESRPCRDMPAGDVPTASELAIAREFVERMGGRLWSDSVPGGTAFSFRLPYTAPDGSRPE